MDDEGESVILFNEEDRVFVQLFNEQSFTGTKINKINRLLDAGKWIQNDASESANPTSCDKQRNSGLKWESNRKGFYFVYTSDCQWEEFQNFEQFATYKSVDKSPMKADDSVILFNQDDNVYVRLFADKAYTGTKLNKINRFLYAGKWKKEKAYSFTIMNDLDTDLYLNSVGDMEEVEPILIEQGQKKHVNTVNHMEWELKSHDDMYKVNFELGTGAFINSKTYIKASILNRLMPNKYKCLEDNKGKWFNVLSKKM